MRAARDALVALATRPAPDRAGREPIAYRDLGVEQLGAVYETLLDYAPRVEPIVADAVSLEPGSGVRKATGHVLHAAAARALPRATHARAAGPRR